MYKVADVGASQPRMPPSGTAAGGSWNGRGSGAAPDLLHTVTAAQIASTPSTATEIPIASDTRRSRVARPWRCINQTTPIRSAAITIGPLPLDRFERRPKMRRTSAITYSPATTAARQPSIRRSTIWVAAATLAGSRPKHSRTLPYKPPGTNSARASMSIDRSATLSSTDASTNQGAVSPTGTHTTPAMKNAGAPSSASARAVARQTPTYDTSVLEVRTTRTRSGAENRAMTSLAARLL